MRNYSSLANLHASAHTVVHHRSVNSDYDTQRMSTAGDIQSHLYSAFLSGQTADVALHVRGSWDGIYRLHRVVLIQAGFFRSLFDGGFREAASKHGGQDEVNVTFDDPNITRAAFEVCLSRLYGGGPPLYVDPNLTPSRKDPLTPSFPRPPSTTETPAGHQNATPRFLLSLLATSIYLSIPSIVSQTILLVLNSLGPHSVIQYLNFAIGKGIGEKIDKDTDIAVGLEHVCQEVRSPGSLRSLSLRSSVSKRSKKSVAHIFDEQDPPRKEEAPEVESRRDPFDSDDDSDLVEGDEVEEGPAFMYGTASNKIGEAAACWLCRWGSDMVVCEEAVDDPASLTSTKQERAKPMRRRATESQPEAPQSLIGLSKENIPLIWRRGGVNAKWARAVLSSDAFFVRDERERYDLARRVVELRRQVSIEQAEEKEWDDLFTNGIHYMHMALDDLIDISQDVSPTTGRPYTPASVIQAAHWNQSVLKHHITYRQSSSSPTTPPRSPAPAREGNLGLSQTTTEILEKLSDHQRGAVDAHKMYYPVPVDASSRIGDTTGLEGASMDQLFSSPAPPSSPSARPGTAKGFSSHTLETFFGILSTPRDAMACITADPTGRANWAPFPPIRFGVEFWGLETLQEKARLTSQTIWYGGSLFNVYVQVVRKKGLQLGMYLHRLSSVETIPIPSSPPSLMPAGEERRWASVQPVNIPMSISTPTLHRPISRGTAITTVPSRSTTPASSYSPPTPSSPGTSPSSHAHSNSQSSISTQQAPRPPVQPYRDPREAVRAHFTLLCSAPTGGALTRFASAPDAFLVGRSWGWKSSALQTEELVEVNADGDLASNWSGLPKRECSLRATVILGVV